MSVLDGSIVNVALPTMAHDLAIAPAASIWIVNAFLLAVTVSLLPLSALGDTIGYRRVYTPGLALFTLGFARLRARAVPAGSHGRARRAGPGRGRDHERQHCPRPLHLSVVEARSGRRQRGGRGRRLIGRKPDRRRRDPFRRVVAMAVPDQCADRPCRPHPGGAHPARHAAVEANARSRQHRAQRPDLRTADRRRRRARRRARTSASRSASSSPPPLSARCSFAGN